MPTLSPYINFPGTAREAMNFYKSVFSGELTVQTISEAPFAAEMPADKQQHVMHSELKSDSLHMLASDMIMNGLVAGNNVSLMLLCSSEEEIDRLFSLLGEGGVVRDPLKVQFWGGKFGALTDRFGVQWVMNYTMNG
jgi:PhnB protein